MARRPQHGKDARAGPARSASDKAVQSSAPARLAASSTRLYVSKFLD